MENRYSIRRLERTLRIVVVLIPLLAFTFAGVVYVRSEQKVEMAMSDIYLPVNNKYLVRATKTNVIDRYDILAKSHLGYFSELIYSVVPDREQINSQLKEAMELGEPKAIRGFIENYQRKGVEFYKRSVNDRSFSVVKDVDFKIDYSKSPHPFKATIIYNKSKGTDVVKRQAIFTGLIKEYILTKNTDRGFYISDITYGSDKPIQ